MLVTKKNIHYTPPCFMSTNMNIPKGTEVVPADNLTEKNRYWAKPWEGMTQEEESWYRNYGFLLYAYEVEEV